MIVWAFWYSEYFVEYLILNSWESMSKLSLNLDIRDRRSPRTSRSGVEILREQIILGIIKESGIK